MTDARVFLTEPVWQNFSSMYREARTAGEAASGMEASHHLTATLYFGISALEAFVNQRMRKYLNEAGKSEADIFRRIRFCEFKKRIEKWPEEILGEPLHLRPGTIEEILIYHEIRSALTHPKHIDRRDYEPLESLDPMRVVDAVAEYIAQFLLAAGERFHYWLWGWNYLNPGKDGHEIVLMFESQIVFSMNALGLPLTPGFPVPVSSSEAWCDTNMRGYSAYSNVARYRRPPNFE